MEGVAEKLVFKSPVQEAFDIWVPRALGLKTWLVIGAPAMISSSGFNSTGGLDFRDERRGSSFVDLPPLDQALGAESEAEFSAAHVPDSEDQPMAEVRLTVRGCEGTIVNEVVIQVDGHEPLSLDICSFIPFSAGYELYTAEDEILDSEKMAADEDIRAEPTSELDKIDFATVRVEPSSGCFTSVFYGSQGINRLLRPGFEIGRSNPYFAFLPKNDSTTSFYALTNHSDQPAEVQCRLYLERSHKEVSKFIPPFGSCILEIDRDYYADVLQSKDSRPTFLRISSKSEDAVVSVQAFERNVFPDGSQSFLSLS